MKRPVFNDGLSREGQCNNNGGTQWTYNQGTILAGLGYLWKATLDETYIQDAWHIMVRQLRIKFLWTLLIPFPNLIGRYH